MVENGAEIQGNASCYYNSLSTAVENSASLVLVPNNSQEGNIKAMTPGVGSEDFTFQRNTTATRVNKDGLIEQVGNNVPRLDHTNGDCPEILIEPQATNLCTQSDPSSLSFEQNISFQENDWGIGLNNKMVFDNQNGTVTSTTGGFSQNSMGFINTNKINRVSFYIKRQDGLKPIISTTFDSQVTSSSLLNNNQIDVFFQDVVSSSKFYYNYTEKEVSNGVWFMTFDFSATAGANRAMGFIKTINNSTNIVEVSGVQVIELDNLFGNPPLLEDRELTSYIPTNGAIATRNADIVTLSNAQDLIGQQEGSVYVEFVVNKQSVSQRISINDGTTTNNIRINIDNLGRISFTTFKNGIQTTTPVSQQFNNGEIIKLCLTYKEDRIALSINGELVSTNSIGNFSNPLTTVRFSAFVPTLFWSSPTKQFSLFKTALTDQEAINLTTL